MMRRALFLVLPLALVACGGAANPSIFDEPDPGATTETGTSGGDSDAPKVDSAIKPGEDGSVAVDSDVPPPVDSGAPAEDSSVADTGTTTKDTGTPPVDTGAPPVDTGVLPTDAPVPCADPGGKVYAGHCYFPLGTNRTFAQARDACLAAGAHLATITTAGESSFVNALGTGERWIGLAIFSGSSTWGWITSEPLTFKNWDTAAGEPNGSGYCARLRPNMSGSVFWADQSCNNYIPAVCERE